VFRAGRYTIRVGEGTKRVTFPSVVATAQQSETALEVRLTD
jgi:hypothetical protein